MLFAGSDDGVYRVSGVTEPGDVTSEKVLDAEDVFHVDQFEGLEGLFVAAKSGLYHSPDGSEWTGFSLPERKVYAVAATPSGDRLYAGTRPARLFVAASDSTLPTDEGAWEEIAGFQELREQGDWSLPRHDNVAQVRSLCTHPDAPDSIIAGVEVGGIHVSDDRGASWTTRSIDGFDAPHLDDVHRIVLEDSETMVVATGSGLYRSTDVGRTWSRLDEGHEQRYFRSAFVHDGSIYAGGALESSSSWEDEDADHALFECHDGQTLEAVSSPTPDEVAVGWCAVGDDVLGVTHRGTLLRRRPDEGWRTVGTVPTSGDVRGGYLPLSWYVD